jgi:hypothetical protein
MSCVDDMLVVWYFIPTQKLWIIEFRVHSHCKRNISFLHSTILLLIYLWCFLDILHAGYMEVIINLLYIAPQIVCRWILLVSNKELLFNLSYIFWWSFCRDDKIVDMSSNVIVTIGVVWFSELHKSWSTLEGGNPMLRNQSPNNSWKDLDTVFIP